MASFNPGSTVLVEGARIVFRNLAGNPGRYNAAGDRNFAVLLDDRTANEMLQDGWNVKWLRGREEGEPDQAFLKVNVKFGKGRPPRIVLIGSRGRTTLTEEMVEMVDWIDIRSVDLLVRPFEWEVNGKSGISAYLKSMYVVVEESALDLKYAEIEEVPR